MKLYKLQRDNKQLIIQMIDWLNKMNNITLSPDDIMQLSGKTKTELIQIWVDCYKSVCNPNADWLEIYL